MNSPLLTKKSIIYTPNKKYDEVQGIYLYHPVYAGLRPAGGRLARQLEGSALLHGHRDRGLLLEVVQRRLPDKDGVGGGNAVVILGITGVRA